MSQIAGLTGFFSYPLKGGVRTLIKHYRFIGINHYFRHAVLCSCQNGALKSFPFMMKSSTELITLVMSCSIIGPSSNSSVT
jgi:hypothetical protein